MLQIIMLLIYFGLFIIGGYACYVASGASIENRIKLIEASYIYLSKQCDEYKEHVEEEVIHHEHD